MPQSDLITLISDRSVNFVLGASFNKISQKNAEKNPERMTSVSLVADMDMSTLGFLHSSLCQALKTTYKTMTYRNGLKWIKRHKDKHLPVPGGDKLNYTIWLILL